jgi:hypothetical protein
VLRRDGGFGLFFVIFPNLIQHIGSALAAISAGYLAYQLSLIRKRSEGTTAAETSRWLARNSIVVNWNPAGLSSRISYVIEPRHEAKGLVGLLNSSAGPGTFRAIPATKSSKDCMELARGMRINGTAPVLVGVYPKVTRQFQMVRHPGPWEWW